MYLSQSLLAVSVALISALPTMAGEEDRPAESQPKQSYTVYCRWIKQHDEFLAFPPLSLSDGKKGSISDTTQSPFVTGVTLVTNPKTKPLVGRPHIVVLEDGMKIDLIVAGRQAEGATVDATVELSKITKVDAKRINSNTTIQIPSVDIRKKRVIDFVKFGETFVVPLGEEPANGKMPRLEIVVAVGEDIRPNWTSLASDRGWPR